MSLMYVMCVFINFNLQHSARLSFVNFHSHLAEQDRKTIFIIRNYCQNLGHLTPKLSSKIFQAQIEPILMYGSEVLNI